MKWRRYTTAEGWPGVHWEQAVPTGETLYARRHELHWRLGVLLGLVVLGLTLGIGLPLLWCVAAGLVAALVVASPELLVALPLPGPAQPGQGPSESERVLEAEARVVRYVRREQRWAELTLDRGSKTLWFMLMGGEAGARKLLLGLPLQDFTELELGTDEEWLGDAVSRELREMARRGAAWVIVTQTASQGVVVIAHSARDKSGMAELHRALTVAFLAGRGALLARVAEMESEDGRA
jgi:hypothetical protein